MRWAGSSERGRVMLCGVYQISGGNDSARLGGLTKRETRSRSTRCISAPDPGLIAFIEGIVEGAAPWLDQSSLTDTGHPFYATNYERVLAVNVHDEWTMHHPHFFNIN